MASDILAFVKIWIRSLVKFEEKCTDENEFENIVCKMAAILFRLQCVNNHTSTEQNEHGHANKL